MLRRLVVRSGDVARPPAATPRLVPFPPTGLSAARASPSLTRDAFWIGDTSRQSNTHSTESRELLYPWHPWYGRSLWIHGALVKSGRVVYRCSLEAQQKAPLLEIPQWMFESTGCCRVHRAENPFVDCAALLDLKLLLHPTRSPVSGLVVQAQHYSVPGGADARIGESTRNSTDRIVSLPTPESGLAPVTERNQTTNRGATGATAARTLPENPERPTRQGERA